MIEASIVDENMGYGAHVSLPPTLLEVASEAYETSYATHLAARAGHITARSTYLNVLLRTMNEGFIITDVVKSNSLKIWRDGTGGPPMASEGDWSRWEDCHPEIIEALAGAPARLSSLTMPRQNPGLRRVAQPQLKFEARLIDNGDLSNRRASFRAPITDIVWTPASVAEYAR